MALPSGSRLQSFGLWAFLGAFLLRLVHAAGVPMPSNDGAQYLWMSESFARGDISDGLNSVFHPGSSLMHAVFVQVGLDSYWAARVDGALLGALWVLLLYRTCLYLADPLSARLVAVLALLSFPGVRLVAEVYSEPLYLVWVSAAVLLLLKGRLRQAAFFLGSAYWIRPEALALLPLLLWPGWRWPRRVQAIAIALSSALALVLLRHFLLGDAALTPKFALMVPLGPLGAATLGDGLIQFVANLVQLPLVGLAGLDHVGLPLGLLGLLLLRRSERLRSRLFIASLALGWLAMCLFQVKPRFFLSQAPLLLPLAAHALHRLRQLAPADERAHRALRGCVALLLVASLMAGLRVGLDLLDPPRQDRVSELAMGEWLRSDLQPTDTIVTDMPRVVWAAGRQPPPPTIWTAERLLAAVRDREPRFVILGRKRAAWQELRATLAEGFDEVPLPVVVAHATGSDRLVLLRAR